MGVEVEVWGPSGAPDPDLPTPSRPLANKSGPACKLTCRKVAASCVPASRPHTWNSLRGPDGSLSSFLAFHWFVIFFSPNAALFKGKNPCAPNSTAGASKGDN